LPGRSEVPRSIGDSLDPVLRSLGGPGTDQLRSLFDDWAEMVGERLAAHTRPSGLRDGALVVVVDDPGWAGELKWMSAQLVREISERLGSGVIDRIAVRVEHPR